MNDALAKNEALSEQLQKLLKAQNTRFELYNEFDIAFKDYLSGKCPAEQYHSICRIVTEGFQDVSSEIQAIEKDVSDTYIKSLIQGLQAAEKEKLQKTANLQILKVKAKESDRDYDDSIKEAEESRKEAVEKVDEAWAEIYEEIHGVSSLIC